jgi:hypothetical protein
MRSHSGGTLSTNDPTALICRTPPAAHIDHVHVVKTAIAVFNKSKIETIAKALPNNDSKNLWGQC